MTAVVVAALGMAPSSLAAPTDGPPVSPDIDFVTAAGSDPLETTAPTTANGLTYDPVLDRYTWTWKTDKRWSGTCRELVVAFSDGSETRARFWFTK